jgi:hypothetical protein
VQLEGLGQLKNPMTSSRIEPATFKLAAECLNQLRYQILQITSNELSVSAKVVFILDQLTDCELRNKVNSCPVSMGKEVLFISGHHATAEVIF